MIKENLAIFVNAANKEEVDDILYLFNTLNYNIVQHDKRIITARTFGPSKQYKLIMIEELRELARPKEYLDENYQLQVTNQPKDGWVEVPDGAQCYGRKNEYDKDFIFYKMTENGFKYFNGDGSLSTSSSDSFDDLEKILWQRTQEETEMKEEKKGRFLHQWAYEALGRGEDVQFMPDPYTHWQDIKINFHSFDLFNISTHKFRLKPRTITIGKRTINAPLDVKPDLYTLYYIPHLSVSIKHEGRQWHNNEFDKVNFERKLCYLNKDDAIAHSEAVLELLNGE